MSPLDFAAYDAPAVALLGDEGLGGLLRLLAWASRFGDEIPAPSARRLGVRPATWARLVALGFAAKEASGYRVLAAARELFAPSSRPSRPSAAPPACEAERAPIGVDAPPGSPPAPTDPVAARRAKAAEKARRARARRRADGVTRVTYQGDGMCDVPGDVTPSVTGDVTRYVTGDASPSRLSLSLGAEEENEVPVSEIPEASSPLTPSLLTSERDGRACASRSVTAPVTLAVTPGDGPRVTLVDDRGERPFEAPRAAPLPDSGSPPPPFVALIAAEVHLSEGVAIDGAASWRSFVDNARLRRSEGKTAFATEAHFRAWARRDARRALEVRVSGGTKGTRGIVQRDPTGPKAYAVASPDDEWTTSLYPPKSQPPAWAKEAAAGRVRASDIPAEWGRFTAHAERRRSPIVGGESAWRSAWERWASSAQTSRRPARFETQSDAPWELDPTGGYPTDDDPRRESA